MIYFHCLSQINYAISKLKGAQLGELKRCSKLHFNSKINKRNIEEFIGKMCTNQAI